jgi:hypothetical protein
MDVAVTDRGADVPATHDGNVDMATIQKDASADTGPDTGRCAGGRKRCLGVCCQRFTRFAVVHMRRLGA